MTIERQKGKITLMCNVCDDEYDTYDPEDFADMLKDAKRDGWSVFKDDDDDWVHMCPNCTLRR